MSRPFKGKDLFWDEYGDHKITPRNILESIAYAQDQISYANLSVDCLERAAEIVIRYATRAGVPLGPSQKQLDDRRQRKERAAHRAEMKRLKLLFKPTKRKTG